MLNSWLNRNQQYFLEKFAQIFLEGEGEGREGTTNKNIWFIKNVSINLPPPLLY